jgi:ribonuclease VapC
MQRWKALWSLGVVIDSSAVMAILKDEPEAAAFATAIAAAPERHISAVSVLEAGIADARRHGSSGSRDLDALIVAAALQVIPFDAEQAAVARHAFQRFGRGRHPAKLNFGDCATYALAKSLGQPLLFKGNDFALTDITPVLQTGT